MSIRFSSAVLVWWMGAAALTCGVPAVLAQTPAGAPAPRGTQAPPAPAPASQTAAPVRAWRFTAINTMRLESWRYFEPTAGGGDPTSTYLGDRLRFDVRRHWSAADLTVAVQYVGMAGLPARAVGPGALGVGALYFDQGGRHSHSGQVYLRFANVRFPSIRKGLDLQVGRMGYTSGAEAPSGVPKIEAVKRQRLDARIVGEFEWSLYQRVFDGVRVDLSRPRWRATGVAFIPTQGGFARAANTTIRDVFVMGGTLSTRPTAGAGAKTQLQGFGWQYRDRRDVTQRPDNTGRTSPTGVEVDVTTAGGTLLGAYPLGRGEADVLVWGALQSGRWFGDDHRASALVLEGGYQLATAPWRPWLRAGVFHASGDDDPADRAHGTFFPMLPTVRRFSQTTAYSTMNLREAFVQVLARPRQALGVRLDVRQLGLASATDLWYAGSGATLSRGSIFGYTGRRSNGSRGLGTSIEASADVTVSSRISINGFVGHLRGGPVVSGTFAGDRLWFSYLETILSLGPR